MLVYWKAAIPLEKSTSLKYMTEHPTLSHCRGVGVGIILVFGASVCGGNDARSAGGRAESRGPFGNLKPVVVVLFVAELEFL
jgi:hypothetical protein